MPATHVPLDYCYALDAARTLLGANAAVICEIPELDLAIHERFPAGDNSPEPGGALWIEPRVSDATTRISQFADVIPIGGQLVIIISQPLSRLLPERRSWDTNHAGTHSRQARTMFCRLSDAGFEREEMHGFHTMEAIAINMLSRAAGAIGRPDWSDRLHFAARLRYSRDGRFSTLATVGLIRLRRVDA